MTYTQSTGSTYLTVSSTGAVSTTGTLVAGPYTATGTTSDPNGDSGTFTYTLTVGTITQSAPTTGSVTMTGSATFTHQLAVTGNNGAVSYTQSTGTPQLTVSSTGLVVRI